VFEQLLPENQNPRYYDRRDDTIDSDSLRSAADASAMLGRRPPPSRRRSLAFRMGRRKAAGKWRRKGLKEFNSRPEIARR